jgi:hypothetical protein
MKQAVCILVVAAFVLLITGAGRTTNQTASPQPTTGAAGATYVNSSIESGNGSLYVYSELHPCSAPGIFASITPIPPVKRTRPPTTPRGHV